MVDTAIRMKSVRWGDCSGLDYLYLTRPMFVVLVDVIHDADFLNRGIMHILPPDVSAVDGVTLASAGYVA